MIQFDRIQPRIFVGTCPSAETDVIRLRRSLGVTAVLNLQTDADFEKWNIDWASMELAYQRSEILVIRLPVVDFDRNDLKHKIQSAGDALTSLLNVGHSVYVHCTAGMERSPATVIAHLVQDQGYTLDQAIDEVRTRRDCAPYVDVLADVYGQSGGDKSETPN